MWKSFLVSYKVKHTLIILFSNSTHWQITLKRSELIPTKRTMTRSSNQCSENRSPVLGGQVLFSHPGSLKLCASCSRNRCTATCSVVGVVDGVCVAATVLKAEIDSNQPQFTSKFSPGTFKPSIDSRVPKWIHLSL